MSRPSKYARRPLPTDPGNVTRMLLESAALCAPANEVFEPWELDRIIRDHQDRIRREGPKDAEWYQTMFNGRTKRGRSGR